MNVTGGSQIEQNGGTGAVHQASETKRRRPTQAGLFARAFLRRRSALVGSVVLLAVVVLAVFAPWLSPYRPSAQDLANRMQPPSPSHPFGTDLYGRDVLSRIISGSRVSLAVGVISVVGAVILGVACAGLALTFRAADTILMRGVDILMVFPPLLLAIAFVAALGPGLVNISIAVGLATLPQFTRVARAEGLGILGATYVEAARAIGASKTRVMLKHVMRSIWPSIVVIATLQVSNAVLLEATLSFFGLGLSPPAASWGSMVSEGRAYLGLAPWLSLFPGFFVLTTVLALNLVGDGLHDALDPHLRSNLGARGRSRS